MESSDSNITWHIDALPRATSKALLLCSEDMWFQDSIWYLAGGTALALQFGHRKSYDLDFFTAQKDFNQQSVASHFPTDLWITESTQEGTLFGELVGAKVSFISYPFFIPHQPFLRYGKVKILKPRDIGVMKILAMSQRGRKRDFVDLYWLCQNVEKLSWFIGQLKDQIPNVAHNYHHIIKSFTYFDDAEKDPMPELNFGTTWPDIKKYFQKEASHLAHNFIGIS